LSEAKEKKKKTNGGSSAAKRLASDPSIRFLASPCLVRVRIKAFHGTRLLTSLTHGRDIEGTAIHRRKAAEP